MYFIRWHIHLLKYIVHFLNFVGNIMIQSHHERMLDPLGGRMAKISSSPRGKIYKFERTHFFHQVK